MVDHMYLDIFINQEELKLAKVALPTLIYNTIANI